MAQTFRLNKVLRELNISIDRAVDFLESKGIEIEKSPNTKIPQEVYSVLLSDEFQTDANKKVASKEVSEAKQKEKEDLRLQREKELEEKAKEEEAMRAVVVAKAALSGPKQVGKIDLDVDKPKETQVEAVSESVDTEPKSSEKKEPEVVKAKSTFKGPKVLDKIDPELLKSKKKPASKAKPVAKEPVSEVKPEVKKTVEPNKEIQVSKTVDKETKEEVVNETVKTQYQKLSGPKSTGQKIDLSQFSKPKKRKKINLPLIILIIRRKRKRISKVNPNSRNQI